jgi:hypothetical protein
VSPGKPLQKGIKELDEDTDNFIGTNRSGKPGGGRKNIREHYHEAVDFCSALGQKSPVIQRPYSILEVEKKG